MGDVFFNRSLTQADIAERTFNAGNARLAFGMMWGAKSDIRSAQVRYSSDEDITACFVRLELHDQKRELYRSQMSSDVTQTGDTNTNTTKNKRKATTDEVSFLEHKHKVKKMTAAVNALGVFSESTTLPDIAPLSPRLKP